MPRLLPLFMAVPLALVSGIALLASPVGQGGPGVLSGEAPAAAATTTGAATGSGIQLLRRELASVLARGAGRSGQWGVLAISTARGDTLFALNPDEPLTPASNQKLFTSAGALFHLGPGFRFPTFLLADGPVENGVLHGNLILYGTGDPALSDRFMDSPFSPFVDFARVLAARGIHTVRGDVLGDGTYFSGAGRRDSWNPRNLNDWYAAPVTGLTFNENVVTLQIRATHPGEAPRILTQPEGAELPFLNRGLTVSGGVRTPLMVVRDHPDDPIELLGQMGAGQADVWRRLTVSDPATYAASMFRRVLSQEGIRVEGRAQAVNESRGSRVTGRMLVAPGFTGTGAGPGAEEGVWTVAVHRSPPLTALLEVVNKRSVNLYADALLMTMGRVVEGDGSFDGGGRVLTRYLTEVVGLDPAGIHVEDGSGLSPLNRATPSALVRLLAHMEGDPNGSAFQASLPEAGNPRELRRMYRSAAAGNLRAKTGTIRRVSALSGTVRTADGEEILFSIIANDVPSPWAAKQVEDRIGIQLASFSRPMELAPDVPSEGVPTAPVTGLSERVADQTDRP
jgi:serine-type D-Ala-D-Ala carboxypeptidase/endopeptidase (penicillin-binding protein 4)